MSKLKAIMKYLLSMFFVGAGVMHFVTPEFYLKIMPPYLPWHLELVYLSGVLEILLGILVI
ncbi:MAG TPA: DoxX family protein, partial [Blastocatellia bacterium]|nr:DoxX family protein [Blastocatellia bacterium]